MVIICTVCCNVHQSVLSCLSDVKEEMDFDIIDTEGYSGYYMYRTLVTICTAQSLHYVAQSGHCMCRKVVTICTAQWLHYVAHSGHYMYRQFNILQFHVLPTQLYLYVLCGSQNKQPLFPYTALTDWFL